LNIQYYNFEDEWVNGIVENIRVRADLAIKKQGYFNIVLSGGQTPILIYKKLSLLDLNWDKWQFWLADERILVNSKSELNKTLIFNSFLDHIKYNQDQIHFLEDGLNLIESISLYQKELNKVSIFDLVLLGIGQDGHTASLFPGNNLGEDVNSPSVLGIDNSPKPPNKRISLSINRLSKSTDVYFLVKGLDKKDIIENILNGAILPCSILRGKNETVIHYCTI
jgi:6-phosphogluconolactonase